MKYSQDIEALLVWTYRDELPKRLTSSADGIWDRIGGLGAAIDHGHGSGSAQRYASIGLPHPDAEAIERAVDRLPNISIDWQKSRPAVMGNLSALLEAHDAILLDTIRPSVLVSHHAVMGTRPPWGEAKTPRPHRIQPRRGPANGAAVVGECRGADSYTMGSHCPLRWSPSVIDIAQMRANYVAWHDALCRLAEMLRGSLSEREPLPPSAPPLPWQVRQKGPRVLVETGRRDLRILLERPRRDTARRRPTLRLGAVVPEGGVP